MKTVVPATERLFRLYHAHCVAPDLDTLFNLLNGIHSLNDKLSRSKLPNFYEFEEFIALKALRNLFHHQEELLNELRLIPVQDLPPITTDLLYLCLVPSMLVEESITALPKKYRKQQEQTVRSILGWYGEVVNINPCIFNFMVKAYELLSSNCVELSSGEFLDFEESYQFETNNGHSHFVTGVISCHAGSVETVLKKAYKNVT